MTRKKIALIALAVVALGLQLVPVDRENPPVVADVGAPPAVDAILRRSCYDCHSSETRWPWYSYVSPLSLFVADHVEDGRAQFSFSEWGSYSERRQRQLRHKIWQEVEAGEMPLPSYLPMHADARLSAADLETLRAWTRTGGD